MKENSCRIPSWLALVMMFLVLFGNARPAVAGRPQIMISDGGLTVSAVDTPLQVLLRDVVATGIVVRIDPAINPEITASFENRDIQAGLAAVLRPYSFALGWEAAAGPGDPGIRLAAIDVFLPGRQDRVQQLGEDTARRITHDPAAGFSYVRDELLLSLKTGRVSNELKRLLSAWDGRIVGREPGMGVFRIRFPAGTDILELVNKLSRHPEVELSAPDYAYPLPERSPVPARPLPAGQRASSGLIPIAVLDSGLSPDEGLEKYTLAGLNAPAPEAPLSDDHGHGTQMALLASGMIAPHGVDEDSVSPAAVISIRVFDESGYTSDFLLMQSIDFALKNGARVMSLSWGSETRSEFLGRALKRAGGRRLIVVASAGNEPTGRPVYPAAFPSVLGVGALGWDGKPWPESNHGPFVGLYAPGMVVVQPGDGTEPGIYGGTSVATAYVANRIAAFLSTHPAAAREEVLRALQGK